MSTKITRAVLEGYLECTYKGQLRLVGVTGQESDYQKMVTEQEAEARARAWTRLLACHHDGKAWGGARLTGDDLGRGAPLVLDATIEDEEASLQFDGLMRVEGVS